MPSDNIKVIPSTDPSSVAVATRTLIVQGLGGVEVPYGLVGIEASGALVPVDATHGLPVTLLAGGHIIVDSISGTVPISAASLPLPTGGATAANQATGNTTLASIDSHVTACDTGAVTISAPLPAGTNALGSVSVSNFPATQSVSGTVAISGTVAVASLAGSVEITNDVGNPIPVSGTVAVSGTVPVSGTFWQVTQPISGTVTANAGSGTFAISAASLPLPSGAATAARQPAIGSAGTAAVDVLTIQGIAAMTALKVDGSGVTQPVSGTVGVSGTIPVSGTFWQATQPISGTVSVNALPATPAGTNIIGKVAIDQTTPGTTNAVQLAAALPAGTNLVGVTVSPPQTGAVYSGTTALTPKFAVIIASASGATTIIALVASKKIRVLSLTVVANAAVNIKFQSHASPTDLTGLLYTGANGGVVLPFSPAGHFETFAGEALDINLSAAVAVGGVLTYVEV